MKRYNKPCRTNNRYVSDKSFSLNISDLASSLLCSNNKLDTVLVYKPVVLNCNIKYENSVVLQEALEPHYIHQIGGKQADDDVVI